MYKYCNSGDTSADTAYATYMYLLESGKEPCEDLKKYIKRMSKSIASRLIATNRNAEAAKFIGLGLLTPAAAKSLYENAVNNGSNDIAAYLMEEMKKNDKKPSMKLYDFKAAGYETTPRNYFAGRFFCVEDTAY